MEITKRMLSLLLAFVMVFSVIPTVIADDSVLADPTELSWVTDEGKVGYISWKNNLPTENHFHVVFYNASDNSQVYETEFWYGSDIRVETPCINDFTNSEADTGEYYFTVQSLINDGSNNIDSNIVKSESFSFINPNKRLSTPTNVHWEGNSVAWDGSDGFIKGNPIDSVIGYYRYELGWSAEEAEEPTDIWFGNDIYRESNETAFLMSDDNHGEGYYFFRVKAMTGDITQALNSFYSEWSEPIYIGVDDLYGKQTLPTPENVCWDGVYPSWSELQNRDYNYEIEIINDEGERVYRDYSDFDSIRNYLDLREAFPVDGEYTFRVRAIRTWGEKAISAWVESEKNSIDLADERISTPSKPVLTDGLTIDFDGKIEYMIEYHDADGEFVDGYNGITSDGDLSALGNMLLSNEMLTDDGYFEAKIRVKSDDPTKILDSKWSEMSNRKIGYTISAKQLSIETEYDATINTSWGIDWFEFTPTETGYYSFESISDGDTYCEFYDSNMNKLDENDDGTDLNFLLVKELMAGETYYFGAKFLNNTPGTFKVVLKNSTYEKLPEPTNIGWNGVYPYWEENNNADCSYQLRVFNEYGKVIYDRKVSQSWVHFYADISEIFVGAGYYSFEVRAIRTWDEIYAESKWVKSDAKYIQIAEARLETPAKPVWKDGLNIDVNGLMQYILTYYDKSGNQISAWQATTDTIDFSRYARNLFSNGRLAEGGYFIIRIKAKTDDPSRFLDSYWSEESDPLPYGPDEFVKEKLPEPTNVGWDGVYPYWDEPSDLSCNYQIRVFDDEGSTVYENIFSQWWIRNGIDLRELFPIDGNYSFEIRAIRNWDNYAQSEWVKSEIKYIDIAEERLPTPGKPEWIEGLKIKIDSSIFAEIAYYDKNGTRIVSQNASLDNGDFSFFGANLYRWGNLVEGGFIKVRIRSKIKDQTKVLISDWSEWSDQLPYGPDDFSIEPTNLRWENVYPMWDNADFVRRYDVQIINVTSNNVVYNGSFWPQASANVITPQNVYFNEGDYYFKVKAVADIGESEWVESERKHIKLSDKMLATPEEPHWENNSVVSNVAANAEYQIIYRDADGEWITSYNSAKNDDFESFVNELDQWNELVPGGYFTARVRQRSSDYTEFLDSSWSSESERKYYEPEGKTIVTVTIDPNGGEIRSGKKTITRRIFAGGIFNLYNYYDQNYEDSIYKSGSILIGFSTNKNATEADYTDNITDVYEDVRVYAVWRAILPGEIILLNQEGQIVYGNKGSVVLPTEIEQYGRQYSVIAWTTDRSGSTWGGFYRGNTYLPGETVTVENGDWLVLYPRIQYYDGYTIYHLGEGRTVTGSRYVLSGMRSTVVLSSGELNQLNRYNPVINPPSDKKLAGWSIEDGGTIAYYPGDYIEPSNSIRHLYAVYEEDSRKKLGSISSVDLDVKTFTATIKIPKESLHQQRIAVRFIKQLGAEKTVIEALDCGFNDYDILNDEYVITTWTWAEFHLEDITSGKYYCEAYLYADGVDYRNGDVLRSEIIDFELPSIKLSTPAKPLIEKTYDGGYKIINVSDYSGLYALSIEGFDEEGKPNRGSIGIRGDFDHAIIYQNELNGHFAEASKLLISLRAIPTDFTEARTSDWSEVSDPIIIERVASETKQEVKKVAAVSESSTAEEKQAAVETIKAIETEELKKAIEIETSNNAFNGGQSEIVSTIENLEAVTGKNADKQVAEELSEILAADEIKVVGAGLNAEEGKHITLEVKKAEKEDVYPTLVNQSVKISIDLVDSDTKESVTEDKKELAVPVVIKLPIPKTINPSFLTIIHYHDDGTTEKIYPTITREQSASSQKMIWYATFVVSSFSDFEFVNDAAIRTENGVKVAIEATSEKVYAAAYDENGKFLGHATLSADNNGVASGTVVCDGSKAATVKFFKLDNSLKPISEAVVYYVTD